MTTVWFCQVNNMLGVRRVSNKNNRIRSIEAFSLYIFNFFYLSLSSSQLNAKSSGLAVGIKIVCPFKFLEIHENIFQVASSCVLWSNLTCLK